MIVLLLLSLTAFAHRPHTPVVGLGVTSDEADVFAVLSLEDGTQLMHSTDFGAHFEPLWSPIKDEDVIGIAFTNNQLVVVAADGTIYQSEDGLEWESNELPVDKEVRVLASGLAVYEDKFAIASREGLFIGELNTPEEALLAESNTIIEQIFWSKSDDQFLLGIDEEGTLLRSNDHGESFARVDQPPAGVEVLTALEYDQDMFVGGDDGAYRYDRVDETWIKCGALPWVIGGDYSEAVTLLVAEDDGTLLATSGQQGVFLSEDSCQNWEASAPTGEIQYGGAGGASETSESFTAIHRGRAITLVASWDGIAVSTDDGKSWRETVLIPPDYTRGISFAPDFPDDPRLFAGGYGSGLVWTADGGDLWEGSAVGLTGVYANQVMLSDTFHHDQRVYFVGNYKLFLSDDAGLSFYEQALPIKQLRSLAKFSDRIYAIGSESDEYSDGRSRLIYSDDSAVSWQEIHSLDHHLAASNAVSVMEAELNGEPAILIPMTLPSGILASFNLGETFEWLIQGPADKSSQMVLWPPSFPTRILHANKETGVQLSDDSGATWFQPETQVNARPDIMISTDDGSIFVMTKIGQMYRSTDGGLNFNPVGEPFAPFVHTIVPAPFFAVRGLILVGTADGIYFSNNAGNSFERLNRYQRTEEETIALHCDSFANNQCSLVETEGLGNRGAWSLHPGDSIEFSFKGDSVHLSFANTGEIRIEESNHLPRDLTTSEGDVCIEGLEGAWRDLTITVIDAPEEGLLFDYLEAYGEGEPLPIWSWEWACGCSDGGSAVLLLPLLTLWRRRR